MSKTHAYNFISIIVVILSIAFGTYSAGSLRAESAEENRTTVANIPEAPASPLPLALPAEQHTLATPSAPSSPLSFPTNSEAPAIDAIVGFVSELGTSNALYEKSATARWPIASITKLMAAVVAFEKYGFDTAVTISKAATTVESAKGNLKVGETYFVKSLLYAMLLESSNEAAEALAEHGGREAFITAMNETATRIGLRDTSFADPTGISSVNQSTAHDLARLADYIFTNYHPLLEISAHRTNLITELKTRRQIVVRNIHPLAAEKTFLGGKTGYTEDANGNLLTLVEYRGRPFMIVVLGAADRTGETRKLYEWLIGQ